MKKILVTLVLLVSLVACGTMNLGGKIKQVEVGMSKQEVVAKLGKSYDARGGVKTPDGTLETLNYYDTLTANSYILNFLNGYLVEWYQESTPPPHVDNGHRH